jgi:hypothetical protein
MPTRFSNFRRVRVLIVVGLVMSWGAGASAQQDSDALQLRKASLEVDRLSLEVDKLKEELQRKAKLESQKLELEARKLDYELSWLGLASGPLVSFLVGALAAMATVSVATRNASSALQVAHRNQIADLDQATHETRLQSYPDLMAATSPLAVYFPDETLDPARCAAIGRAISKWYFKSGLLLSGEARDAYFRLAHALTLASGAKELCVPHVPYDGSEISDENLRQYRRELFKIEKAADKLEEPTNMAVEEWRFGPVGGQPKANAYKFKDYVFLQTLSSRLRTRLTEDLSSRRRPGVRSV